ncbi:cytidine/deoxycytidylate deaminase family protein [Patescibacteria group bacterium]|nr:cytidine/deoxycytidylate deaminase family protein [Patescibacteria group bacterium]
MSRPTWDEYFMEICRTAGNRSTCDRGKTGAVIVKDKRIIATGYAGSPVGLLHCDEAGHEFKDTIHADGSVSKHCVRTVHAEQNAIAQAAKFGTAIEGSTVYCTMTPCYVCAKMLINAGIKKVVADKDYHAGDDTKRVFKEAGITFQIVDNKVTEYVEKVSALPEEVKV